MSQHNDEEAARHSRPGECFYYHTVNPNITSSLIISGVFQFISTQINDNDVKPSVSLSMRRTAKSHAVKQALEHKRRIQQESNTNFYITTSQDKPSNKSSRKKRGELRSQALAKARQSSIPRVPVTGASVDPFQAFAVNSSRFASFLQSCKLIPNLLNF